MKYIMIIILSLSSQLALTSYHDGESAGGSYDDDGYSSGSSAAYALVGVGVLYYIFRNKDENTEAGFSNSLLSPESNNQLVVDFEKAKPFIGQDSFSYDPFLEKDFQVNLKFKFN